MPSTRKPGGKDAARKRTANPPPGTPKPEAEARDPLERAGERQVGQYTGAGTPPLQKK